MRSSAVEAVTVNSSVMRKISFSLSELRKQRQDKQFWVPFIKPAGFNSELQHEHERSKTPGGATPLQITSVGIGKRNHVWTHRSRHSNGLRFRRPRISTENPPVPLTPPNVESSRSQNKLETAGAADGHTDHWASGRRVVMMRSG